MSIQPVATTGSTSYLYKPMTPQERANLEAENAAIDAALAAIVAEFAAGVTVTEQANENAPNQTEEKKEA